MFFVIIVLVLIWFLFFSWPSKSTSINKKNTSKYNDRVINNSLSLYDRNIDIINSFSKDINAVNYGYYYIENLTRDCINEICLAENVVFNEPWHKYLRDWIYQADPEWKQLAIDIEEFFNKREKELKLINKEIVDIENNINELSIVNAKNLDSRNITKIESWSNDMFVGDIDSILNINDISWYEREEQFINKNIFPNTIEEYKPSIITDKVKNLNKTIREYNKNIELNLKKYNFNSAFFNEIFIWYQGNKKEFLLRRIDYILNYLNFPNSLCKEWYSDYDEEQKILILELKLPNLVNLDIYKKVQLKTKISTKSLTKSEFKINAPKIHPSMILRTAYEIFRNDRDEIINLLVINGFVKYNKPSTGKETTSYISSLTVNRKQILDLNLSELSPIDAFLNLKGKTSWIITDIIPIVPTLSLDREDKRFINTKEVLDNINHETNLAWMDWQDFENLIAELFEKEFSEKWAEVKVTQSSRDRWVDAIVFDPDPIKWWKYVIQAKRYTRTVDVSAVRDLCAVVKKEWASRWILVTTSSYWPDAYTFAQNEPITLLNGQELLGLLEKHWYNFKINIAEAREILKNLNK